MLTMHVAAGGPCITILYDTKSRWAGLSARGPIFAAMHGHAVWYGTFGNRDELRDGSGLGIPRTLSCTMQSRGIDPGGRVRFHASAEGVLAGPGVDVVGGEDARTGNPGGCGTGRRSAALDRAGVFLYYCRTDGGFTPYKARGASEIYISTHPVTEVSSRRCTVASTYSYTTRELHREKGGAGGG
eukprot:COSAG02_NODE_47_length_45434_cov_101.776221_11_plen_185_part_00